jgi:hypothetical protein
LLAKQSLQKRCALLVLDDDAKETDGDDDDVDDDVDDEDDVKDDCLVVSNRNPPNSRVTLFVVA